MKYFNEKEKIWRAKPATPVFNPNVSVGEVILWMLQRSPNKIGQISDDSGARLTNGEIRLKTIRAVENLANLGFTQGDVFGFMARNSQHLAPIVLAALTLGCPINPMDVIFDQKEVTHLFGITRPKVVFCDVDKVDIVKDSLKKIGLIVRIFTFSGVAEDTCPVEDLFEETGSEEDFVAPLIKDVLDHTAFILCSSGTTGISKGVAISHSAALLQGSQFSIISEHDIILCWTSIYWVSGLMTLVSGCLRGAVRVISTDPLTPNGLLQVTERHRVTFILTGTSVISEIMQHSAIESADLSSVKFYLFGGMSYDPDIIEKFKSYLPNGQALEAYGSTELCLFVTYSYPESRKHSAGKMLNGFQMKVIDDNGKKCGIGEIGEIHVKFPHMFLQYYKNPEATAMAFDEEGWFRTGDIGHLDEDGFLFYKERKSEIIRYRRFHISPSEIEALLRSNPGVRNVCVVGVPDPIVENLLVALVVKVPELQVTAEELQNLVKDTLTDYKQIRGGVFFVTSIPITPTGKNSRWKAKELAKRFLQETS